MQKLVNKFKAGIIDQSGSLRPETPRLSGRKGGKLCRFNLMAPSIAVHVLHYLSKIMSYMNKVATEYCTIDDVKHVHVYNPHVHNQ